ncbi:MAG: DUF3859 domain-containing protein [Gammaproteobacteria bacterium]|nr:DUF3859 domain-containing protein [Gammaproteobacteria bacterium]
MIWSRQVYRIQLSIQVAIIAFMVVLAGCVNQPEKSGRAVSSDKIKKEPNKKALIGKVTKRGLYEVIRSGGLVDSPNTSTGKAISKPVIQLVRQTDRIPLVKDAHMSLQYRIWNLPERPAYTKLRRVLKHPPMKLPDGTVTTGSDYMITGKVLYGQVVAYTGYGLNEDYEMVEGDWIFQIWYEDKKMIEQKFTTYWPK